jgi:hypothetical protein
LTDIPNYIGLPLSIILGIITSVAILVYQNDILEFVNKRKQMSLMKHKNKAIEKYIFYKKMHDDALFFQTTMKQEEQIVLADGFMAVLFLIISVGFLQNSTHEIVRMIASAFDLNIGGEQSLSIVKEIQRNDFQHTDAGYVFALTVSFIFFTTTFGRLAALQSMVKTTGNFKKFEAEIMKKWPDALEEQKEASE